MADRNFFSDFQATLHRDFDSDNGENSDYDPDNDSNNSDLDLTATDDAVGIGSDSESSSFDDSEDEEVWTIVGDGEESDSDDEQIPFTQRNSGPVNIPPETDEPIDFLKLFFPENEFVNIVRQTNKYAHDTLSDDDMKKWMADHPKSRFHNWPDKGITVTDLKKFVGLTINMGLVNKKELSTYWTSSVSQLTPFFGRVLSLSKYQMIG